MGRNKVAAAVETNGAGVYTITTVDSQRVEPEKTTAANGSEDGAAKKSFARPTSYLETIMNLFKGNVGPGLFALGDAFKNGGLIAAPFMTVFLGLVCVHCQHILIRCANRMQLKSNQDKHLDFGDTVKLCFQNGSKRVQSSAGFMKLLTNIFLCLTQLGFCCVYLVFIASNLQQVLESYEINWHTTSISLLIFFPVLIPALFNNLRFIAYFSVFANICMVTGIIITLAFTFQNLPSPTERNYVSSWEQLPLFFGTTIFAFEGISLVLPLKNSMKTPSNFYSKYGVLNVGMVIVTTIFLIVGFFGYLKYGEEVLGSLTLNLPKDSIWGQIVKIVISMGILLGYALQFFVAIQIMLPGVERIIKIQNSLLVELSLRLVLVIFTFLVAIFVPKLSLVISLVGALCSTALALVFPPIIELVTEWETSGPLLLIKNIVILIIAFLGFITGTTLSIMGLINS